MEFNINKGSTLNRLRLELIQDGRNDFQRFNQAIQNANIYFSMVDIITGVKVIGRRPAVLDLVIPPSCTGDEFYIAYQFSSKETSRPGRYVGLFEIDFLDGSGLLIAPIAETLFINVLDQGIRK